jgi:hypothetical protein
MADEWQEWKDWKKPGQLRIRAHAMTKKMKRLPWPYCAHCGLMALKNDASRREMKKPCVVEE